MQSMRGEKAISYHLGAADSGTILIRCMGAWRPGSVPLVLLHQQLAYKHPAGTAIFLDALRVSQAFAPSAPVYVSHPSSRLPPFPYVQTSLFSKAPGSGTHLRTGSQEAAGAGSFFKDTAARTKEGFAKIGNFIRVANALTGDHAAGGQGGEGSHH